jgi:hypothetical protein
VVEAEQLPFEATSDDTLVGAVRKIRHPGNIA